LGLDDDNACDVLQLANAFNTLPLLAEAERYLTRRVHEADMDMETLHGLHSLAELLQRPGMASVVSRAMCK
jgi:hypothetical protein